MKVKLEEVCKRIYAGGDVPKDRYSAKKTDILVVGGFDMPCIKDGKSGKLKKVEQINLNGGQIQIINELHKITQKSGRIVRAESSIFAEISRKSAKFSGQGCPQEAKKGSKRGVFEASEEEK